VPAGFGAGIGILIIILVMGGSLALDAMRPFLEPGESAVDTEIEVRHLAATPVVKTFAPRRK
jgi:predicted thioesterase